ncbi:hypothetical protein OGAPHI_004921 [Ogataea philodendri]|uniref:Transcription factor domain-containing protein n=1 Tax=Ogataea philodendri TaxID=1378263 RepID=A0A9P8P1Q2_9ASCO|nr:uncharacterized protein OGAPHI_004921 [Ogataea philodendri]KAH3663520.1 hypothetical protein OGAPHI_004921 [Ogataea philodendri]
MKADKTRPRVKSAFGCVCCNGRVSVAELKKFALRRVRNPNFEFVYETNFGNKPSSPEAESAASSPGCTELVAARSQVVQQEVIDDAMFRKYLATLCNSAYTVTGLNGYNSWVHGVQMNSEEAYLYDAFVKGFMVSVSPQLTHTKLQPGVIFIPQGSQSPWLLDIFYACGAAFLSSEKEEMRALAEARFSQVMRQFDVVSNLVYQENNQWVLIGLLSLCLREKYFGKDHMRTIVYLKLALEMIRSWPKTKLLQRRCVEVKIDDITSAIDLQEHALTPSERTLVESFAYNYAIIGLLCDKETLMVLDSPFEVFEELNPLLSQQLYECPAPWMNNPVMGAALPAFELASKAGWLQLQYPFNAEMFQKATTLLRVSKFMVPPVLPPDVKFKQPKHVQKRLLDSCCTARIVVKGAYVLLFKLLNPEKPATEPEIQHYIKIHANKFGSKLVYQSFGAVSLDYFPIPSFSLISPVVAGEDHHNECPHAEETDEGRRNETVLHPDVGDKRSDAVVHCEVHRISDQDGHCDCRCAHLFVAIKNIGDSGNTANGTETSHES